MTETTRHGIHVGARPPEASRQPYTGADEERGRPMTRTPVETSAAGGVRAREALARADRIQIALLAGLFALLSAMLGAGALGYTALSGQLLAIQQNTHEEIAGLRVEMHEEFRGLRADMQQLSERMARIETMIEFHHGPLPGS